MILATAVLASLSSGSSVFFVELFLSFFSLFLRSLSVECVIRCCAPFRSSIHRFFFHFFLSFEYLAPFVSPRQIMAKQESCVWRAERHAPLPLSRGQPRGQESYVGGGPDSPRGSLRDIRVLYRGEDTQAGERDQDTAMSYKKVVSLWTYGLKAQYEGSIIPFSRSPVICKISERAFLSGLFTS